jgi:hypothetical protein
MNWRVLILIAGALAPAFATAAPDAPKYIGAGRSAAGDPLPFSEGVLVGNTLTRPMKAIFTGSTRRARSLALQNCCAGDTSK